jgi:hypothetical protein
MKPKQIHIPILPDVLLTLKNGKKVTDAKKWWNVRHAEIIEDLTVRYITERQRICLKLFRKY